MKEKSWVKNDYTVVCMTSDKYLDALRPYAWLMNRYWVPNPRVVVAGFSRPDFELPSNFEFYSIGNFEDYPIERWSDALKRVLTEGPISDVFVFMLEDYWPTRDVDTEAVQILVDYAKQFNYVAKIDLAGDRLYAHGADLTYSTAGRLDLVKSMPGSPYHLSLMTGVWRKKHLLDSIQPGWSPWDVELLGTPILSHNQNVIVLGTRQWPVRHTLAFRSGNSNELKLDEILQDDVIELSKLGYLKPWGVEYEPEGEAEG